MRRREELQTLLETLLGKRNVYFQPPPSMQLQYPAIVYSRSSITNRYADNSVYNHMIAYQLVVIDKDPDSEIVSKVSKLQYCKHTSNYKADGLNHDTFLIYY